MSTRSDVGVYFRAYDQASGPMRSLGLTTQNLTKQFATLAGVGGGLYGAVRLLGSMKDAAIEQDRAERALAASIGSNVDRWKSYAKSLQSVTIHSDEAILGAMTFAHNLGIEKEQLESVTRSAIGLSSRFNKDLDTSMRLIALASKGETGQLKEMGIVLDANATSTERYAELVRIGADSFHLAEEQAKDLAGQTQQLDNKMQDLKATLGQPIAELWTGGLWLLGEAAAGAKKELDALNATATPKDIYAGLSPELRRSLTRALPAPDLSGVRIYGPYAGSGKLSGTPNPQAVQDYTRRLIEAYERSGKVQERVRQDIAKQVGRPLGEVTALGPQPFDESALWTGNTPINFEGQFQKIIAWKEKAKDTSTDVMAAWRRMASDMDRTSAASWEVRRDILEEERKKYAELMPDRLATVEQWHTERLALLGIEEGKAKGGVFTGFKAGIAEMNLELETSGELGANLATTLRDGVVGSISDAIFEARDLGDALREVGRSMARMAMEWALNQAVTGGMNMAFGVKHAGGVVGPGGLARMMPVGLLNVAPRLHGGLAADEFPAILQRGETVIPRGGATPNVAIQVVNNGTAKNANVGRPRWDGDRWVIGVVLDDLEHGGPLSQRMGR